MFKNQDLYALPQNLTFNEKEALNLLKLKEKQTNNNKLNNLETPQPFEISQNISKDSYLKENILTNPIFKSSGLQNFDASLNKYQTILSKLKNESSQQNLASHIKLQSSEPQLENDQNLKNSIFSNLIHEKMDLESFQIDQNPEENSFQHDISLKLSILDERKKQLFEQRLNEEISNEFSEDSEKKMSPEYIHIQDLISHSSENNNWGKNLSTQFKDLNYISNNTPIEVLDIDDVISNKETVNFLKKLRKIFQNEKFLTFDNFFNGVIAEMDIVLESDQESEVFLALQDVLTTDNHEKVSLNALEIFTKDNGLKISVLKLLESVKAGLKVKKNEEINNLVFEEIAIIKEMLDKKHKDLVEKEQKLKYFEGELVEREERILEIIENFYHICEKNLESYFKEQLSQINKRLVFGEKNMKSKLKLLETKAKELKSQSQQELTRKNDDKLKARVQILEKNNEFLKLKLLDLEKKLTLEKENNQLLSNKMSKITIKNTNQDKIIKEMQKTTIKIESENIPTNQSIISKTSENYELEAENTSEKEKNMKPKTIIKKKSEDSIILLNLFSNISHCLKTTLPVLLQEENPTTNEDNEHFDIGSVFFPNFNKIVSDLIELSPILNKKYEVKGLHNYVDFFFSIVDFAFRFKSQNNLNLGETKNGISSKKLESSCLKVKSLQDHVNEVMFSSSKSNFELIFTPQSEFWKKLLKKLTASKTKKNIQEQTMNKPFKSCFPLFQSETLQDELIKILKKYLEDTAFCLNQKKTNNSTNQSSFEIPIKNSLENQKFIIIIRIKLCLLICLLSSNHDEINQALEGLFQNINNENEAMNDYMKKILLENDSINIIFSLIPNIRTKFNSMSLIIDLLLNMSSNGEHYKGFILEISEENRIEILMKSFLEIENNDELCEKLAVIIQKITYHNNMKGKISITYLNGFKEKLRKIEKKHNMEFFIINLKSILNNIIE